MDCCMLTYQFRRCINSLVNYHNFSELQAQSNFQRRTTAPIKDRSFITVTGLLTALAGPCYLELKCADKLRCIESLKAHIASLTHPYRIIIGGDFNCTLDPTIDRTSAVEPHPSAADTLQSVGKHRITKEHLCLPLATGGQGLVDIRARIQTLRIQYVHCLLNSNYSHPCFNFTKWFLNRVHKMKYDNQLFYIDFTSDMYEHLPSFNRSLFNVWGSFNISRQSTPVCTADVRNEALFLNPFIRGVNTDLSLLYQDFIDGGITTFVLGGIQMRRISLPRYFGLLPHSCRPIVFLRTLFVVCFLILIILIRDYRWNIFRHVPHRKLLIICATTPNNTFKLVKISNASLVSSPQQLDWLVEEENKRKANISCPHIFSGNQTELDKAKTIKYIAISELAMINVTSDCAAYQKARGYITSNVPEDEAGFPISYSILTYNRIDELERLLRAIYRPQNIHCIHVDRKSNQTFLESVRALADCFSNVFLSSRREVIVYGGYTRLQADLNCFKDLLKYDWKYVLNCASSEFPLRTNGELVKILRILNGSNVVEQITQKRHPYRWQSKYVTIVNETDNSGKIEKIEQEYTRAPFNLFVTKGSAYAVFSRRFIEYLFSDDRASEFLDWCKYTYSPDEIYWSTLNNLVDNPILETPGGAKHRDTDSWYLPRIADWNSGKCHGKYVHGVCVFGAGDLPWLLKRPELIANKFDPSMDSVAYDCIEELLFSRRQLSDLDEDVYKHRLASQDLG